MKTSVKLRVLPIEDDGFHLQVDVLVNGKIANFLVDSGASRTVFDRTRIGSFIGDALLRVNNEKRSTGLGTNTMEIQNAMIRSFRIGETEVTEMDGAILDLSHVNESYITLGLDQIDGVLGNDILLKFGAVIDFREEVLHLDTTSG